MQSFATAGLYRTGKSYLLNALMGKPAGFTVGPTVKACTQGIWLWGKAIPAIPFEGPTNPTEDGKEVDTRGLKVLFMDTEGLGSTKRSETYDTRVFALALLLSSCFVYNSVGTIDGSAISKLSLVVNLTKHIHVRSHAGSGKPAAPGAGAGASSGAGSSSSGGVVEDSGTEYRHYFPQFVWVVRDFGVKLERNGRHISSSEYLSYALEDEPGVDDSTERKNVVRRMLREFFPERDCVTMVRPISDEKKLNRLFDVPWEEIRPQFRKQLEGLRRKVLGGAKPKILFGQALDGPMLASLAEAYVEALNQQGTPVISTAWDRVVEGQCREAAEKGLKVYQEAMKASMRARGMRGPPAGEAGGPMGASGLGATQETLGLGGGIVLESSGMELAHTECLGAARETFRKEAVDDAAKAGEHEQLLLQRVIQHRTRCDRANEDNSRVLCEGALQFLHEIASRELMEALEAQGEGQASDGAREDKEEQAKQQEVDAGADGSESLPAAVPATQVASAYKRAVERLQREYLGIGTPGEQVEEKEPAGSSAGSQGTKDPSSGEPAALPAGRGAGPRKHACLAGYLVEQAPRMLGQAADASSRRQVERERHLRRALESARRAEAAAQGRARATEESLERERKEGERALAQAAKEAALEQEKHEQLVSSLQKAQASMQSKFEQGIAFAERVQKDCEERASEAESKASKERAGAGEARAELAAELRRRGDSAEALAEAQRKLLEASEARRLAEGSLGDAVSAKQVLEERLRGAQAELTRLREQSELLYDKARSQKELLGQAIEQKQECELQWGMAKAQVAELESEKAGLETDLETLESLARTMKDALVALR